jgi:ketosteroid isomerase-like protein
MSRRALAEQYFRAIEERGDVDRFFTDDVVQEEFPNRLVPTGARRDRAALREARARGLRVLTGERYEIVHAIEQGDALALEVRWCGSLAVPLGETPAGGTIEAHFGVFLTFVGDRIASQRNYDCFAPF